MNAAFDVVQNPNWFSQEDFVDSHEKVLENILRPARTIKRDGGFFKMLKDEFLTSRLVPNLFLHTIGGAYDFSKIRESFKRQGVKNDFWWSVALRYAGHFGNEALELSKPDIVTSHDNIMDMYFFDVMAIVLANNNTYSNFMTNTLDMRAWHNQPVLLIDEVEHVSNTGLHYVIRPNFFSSKFRPFAYVGMQLYGGVSFEVAQNEFYTVAAGYVYTDPLEYLGRWSGALFYDKINALAASFIYNGAEDYRFRLNLYPEIFNFNSVSLGVLIGQKFDDGIVLGAQVNMPIGFGIKL